MSPTKGHEERQWAMYKDREEKGEGWRENGPFPIHRCFVHMVFVTLLW